PGQELQLVEPPGLGHRLLEQPLLGELLDDVLVPRELLAPLALEIQALEGEARPLPAGLRVFRRVADELHPDRQDVLGHPEYLLAPPVRRRQRAHLGQLDGAVLERLRARGRWVGVPVDPYRGLCVRALPVVGSKQPVTCLLVQRVALDDDGPPGLQVARAGGKADSFQNPLDLFPRYLLPCLEPPDATSRPDNLKELHRRFLPLLL